MYTLYYAPGAASLVVHWLLIEIGAPYELVRLDFEKKEQKSAEYLKLNPAGVVPTLIIDGAPVSECAALTLLLAERHPDAGLDVPAGAPGRAAYLQWTLTLANTLQPSFRLWWYPVEGAGAGQEAATQALARERIEAVFERLDAHLSAHGPYLCGERISAVDFYACMLMRWSRNMPKPAHIWPALAAFAVRMKARPSFKALYAREGLSEWA